MYVCPLSPEDVNFWFWREIVFGVTYVLRVQCRYSVVSLFWFWQEIVFGVTYVLRVACPRFAKMWDACVCGFFSFGRKDPHACHYSTCGQVRILSGLSVVQERSLS